MTRFFLAKELMSYRKYDSATDKFENVIQALEKDTNLNQIALTSHAMLVEIFERTG